jgi:hypothetical protein
MRNTEFWSIPFRRCKYSAGHAYFTICILPFGTHYCHCCGTATPCVYMKQTGTYRAQTYTNLYVKYPVHCSSVTNVYPSLQKTHVTGTLRAQHKFTHILQPSCTVTHTHTHTHTHTNIRNYTEHTCDKEQTIRIPAQQTHSNFCYTNIGAACK